MWGGHLALPTWDRDRAPGFASLGMGLAFNTLPMGSGCGGLQLPAQPGLELPLQGGFGHWDDTAVAMAITRLGVGQGELWDNLIPDNSNRLTPGAAKPCTRGPTG